MLRPLHWTSSLIRSVDDGVCNADELTSRRSTRNKDLSWIDFVLCDGIFDLQEISESLQGRSSLEHKPCLQWHWNHHHRCE